MITEQSQSITRRSASNLALAFILLPREKREAMTALYAFCREVDDVADEETRPVEERRAALGAWREDVRRACAGGETAMPTNRQLQPVIPGHKLSFPLFDELIRGCEMDLEQTRYKNYDEVELYCYRVASVVGLLSIEIFGYHFPGTRDYAIALGKALQFTNILRDVGNDARRGRIYLPQVELDRFGVKPEEILRGEYSDRFRALATEFARRAKAHYRTAQETLSGEDRPGMVAAELMGSVYWRLLLKLERKEFRVLHPEPLRLSQPHKLALIIRCWLKFATRSTAPSYGVAGRT
jgi:15-cis-phytoene synthase